MGKLSDLLGSCNTAFQLGIGGAQVRSSSGKIQARNAANNALATLECADLIVGGNRVTVSDTAPVSPATGDRWYETSGGLLKYIWHWAWNGTYWLSPQMYWTSGFVGLAANTDSYFPIDPNFNYYFSTWRTNHYILTTNNASNYWASTIVRKLSNDSNTTITSVDTSGLSPNGWSRSADLAITTHVNVSATSAYLFSLRHTRTGSPGALSTTVQIAYHYARI